LTDQATVLNRLWPIHHQALLAEGSWQLPPFCRSLPIIKRQSGGEKEFVVQLLEPLGASTMPQERGGHRFSAT
jgi:hypothetical protein